MKRGPVRYVLNLLLGIDETGNAVLAGDPSHTISARTGQALVRGKPWARYFAGPVVNALMLNRRHCVNAAVDEGLITPEEEAAYLARHGGL